MVYLRQQQFRPRMSVEGQKHALRRRSITVRFTPVSGSICATKRFGAVP